MAINDKKYQDTILYLCHKLGGELRGKKKLAKLLYFADFDFYEKYERSITGDIYRAFPMGPLPTSLDDITGELVSKKKMSIQQDEIREGYNPAEKYICHVGLEESSLDMDERKMLDRIILKYGHLNGKELEELSHAEAPYIATPLREEIPYELTFYRGTDFGDLK